MPLPVIGSLLARTLSSGATRGAALASRGGNAIKKAATSTADSLFEMSGANAFPPLKKAGEWIRDEINWVPEPRTPKKKKPSPVAKANSIAEKAQQREDRAIQGNREAHERAMQASGNASLEDEQLRKLAEIEQNTRNLAEGGGGSKEEEKKQSGLSGLIDTIVSKMGNILQIAGAVLTPVLIEGVNKIVEFTNSDKFKEIVNKGKELYTNIVDKTSSVIESTVNTAKDLVADPLATITGNRTSSNTPLREGAKKSLLEVLERKITSPEGKEQVKNSPQLQGYFHKNGVTGTVKLFNKVYSPGMNDRAIIQAMEMQRSQISSNKTDSKEVLSSVNNVTTNNLESATTDSKEVLSAIQDNATPVSDLMQNQTLTEQKNEREASKPTIVVPPPVIPQPMTPHYNNSGGASVSNYSSAPLITRGQETVTQRIGEGLFMYGLP